jgi:hypothetical protein
MVLTLLGWQPGHRLMWEFSRDRLNFSIGVSMGNPFEGAGEHYGRRTEAVVPRVKRRPVES